MNLFTFLVELLVGGLFFYAVYIILGLFPITPPVKSAILVIIGLIAAIWVLSLFVPNLGANFGAPVIK